MVQRARPHILFVDDDESLRRITQRLLARRGYRVWVASDDTDALNVLLLNPEQIDLVISNVVIPRVGERTNYLFTREGLTRNAPGTAFLAKPWTTAELEASILAVHGQSAEERDIR